MKKCMLYLPCLLLSLALLLCGCGNTKEAGSAVKEQEQAAAESGKTQPLELPLSHPAVGAMFTKRDFDSSYKQSGHIQLQDGASTTDSNTVRINGDTITIAQDGVYTLSGTLSRGQIVVQAPETAKVQLVLDNASVTSADSAALYVICADKVFITTAAGSENALVSSGGYPNQAVDKIDGAIYAKTDLCFNGAGKLQISSQSGHGIVTKDDLKICSGSYEITAAKKGLSGKDSVRIGGGEIFIRSQGDGIHSEHTKSDKGFVFISGGSLQIESVKDGIDCSNSVEILGGTVDICSGGGAGREDKSEESCKGIRSLSPVTISGGRIRINAADDGIKSDGDIFLNGGELTVYAARDGVESKGALSIEDCVLASFTREKTPGEPQSHTHGVIRCSLSAHHEAGDRLALENEAGEVLLQLQTGAACKNILLACPKMTEGVYRLICEEEQIEITISAGLWGEAAGN